VIDKVFKMNQAIKKRMEQVVGSKNYSLCFRNCEHLAWYVTTGYWVSPQIMALDGPLMGRVRDIMVDDNLYKINTFPDPLHNGVFDVRPPALYDFKDNSPYKATHVEFHPQDDSKRYCTLLIGPTGSGKSSCINAMFNAYATSVPTEAQMNISWTKEMYFIFGSGYVGNAHLPVTVIDTVGLCDTSFEHKIFDALLRMRVTAAATHIHRLMVVFNLLTPVTLAHQQSAKSLLAWFNKSKTKGVVELVITHCDKGEEKDVTNYANSVKAKLGLPAETRVIRVSLNPELLTSPLAEESIKQLLQVQALVSLRNAFVIDASSSLLRHLISAVGRWYLQ